MKKGPSFAIETPAITAVFSQFEYKNIPFAHLHQLEMLGITNICILLDEDEFKMANQTKFIVFDGTKEATILEHYQAQSKGFNFRVINTGTASSEEEKLKFYLNNTQEHPLLHLFLYKGLIPWASEEICAKREEIVIREYPWFPFLNSSKRKRMPLFQPPCSSEEAIELLQSEMHPCFCYKLDLYDVLHYQWLFNIFVELTTLKIAEGKSKHPDEYSEKLNELITAYNKNIIALEKAEELFNETHKIMYRQFGNPPYQIITEPGADGTLDPHIIFEDVGARHQQNVREKAILEDNFPQILRQLVNMYNELAMQENINKPSSSK